MAKQRTRMEMLQDVIYYGERGAKLKWLNEDGFEELKEFCAK